MDDNDEDKARKFPKRTQLSREALFRRSVMSELDARLLRGKDQKLAGAIREVMGLPHADHDGSRGLFARTLYRWHKAFREEGLTGLEPDPRERIADSTVLSREFLAFLRLEKGRDAAASVPELIRRARLKGILGQDEAIHRATVWRACERMGLPVSRLKGLAQADMRPFAYPNRMLMALADGKHFRAGVRRAKRVAIIFLDDATRFGLDLSVGTVEDTYLFLRGLYETISCHGLMTALFLDNGGGFTSDETLAVVANLGIHLIHGTAGYPEGHGKIERLNQTILNGLLRNLDGNAEVDPDPDALRLRLRHYLHEVYNKSPHESLGGETPAARFAADPRPLVFPKDRAWLDDSFVATFNRSVSKHNLISYEGKDYEIPVGHAGTSITISRRLMRDPEALFILHEGRTVRLEKPDLSGNAYARRAQKIAPPEPKDPTPVKNAAQMAFEKDFAPLVDEDGGYRKAKKGENDD